MSYFFTDDGRGWWDPDDDRAGECIICGGDAPGLLITCEDCEATEEEDYEFD